MLVADGRVAEAGHVVVSIITPSLSPLVAVLRRLGVSMLFQLLLQLPLVGGDGSRCSSSSSGGSSSLLGGSLNVPLVQFASQQSVKKARFLVRRARVVTSCLLVALRTITRIHTISLSLSLSLSLSFFLYVLIVIFQVDLG